MKLRYYIAAPFFVTGELAVVSSIENILEEAGLSYFSPRKQGRVDLSSPENRRQVFDKNMQELQRCDVLLAWMQRANKDGERLVVYREPTSDRAASVRDVCLPDTGVVWEVGAAYALGKTVVLLDLPAFGQSRANLMLSQGAVGTVRGLPALDAFVNTPITEWSSALSDAAHLKHDEEHDAEDSRASDRADSHAESGSPVQ